MQMFNSEQLQEKWAPVLDYDGMDPIKDSHRRAVTAILLENQERSKRRACIPFRSRLLLTQLVPQVQPLVSVQTHLHQPLVSILF